MNKMHQHFGTRTTPQAEPIPGSAQTENSAGGFSWRVDDWTRLDRFLILGSEGGSYYASEAKLTKDNAAAVLRCIASDGLRVVKRVVEISDSGRAPKNDPALFALAACTAASDKAVRIAAFAALPSVARIGTHLFHFAAFREAFGGWGRSMRQAVAAWYLDRSADQLAMQLVKYQSRDGWGHRDLLRLSHPTPSEGFQRAAFSWVVSGGFIPRVSPKNDRQKRGAVHLSDAPALIVGYERMKGAADAREAVRLIREYNLPREAVKTEFLREPEVWSALLENMGLEALVRNLGTMSKVGLLTPMSDAEKVVIDRLSDGEVIRKSRLHPIKALTALLTYNAGHGVRSDASWAACPRVVDALDAAFYSAFDNIPQTDARLTLALDVSGSMGGGQVGGVIGLTPRIAAAALAMVAAKAAKQYACVAFQSELTPFNLSPRERLDAVVQRMNCMSFGGTDCSLPMLWALRSKLAVDGFVVYTDSETWAGGMHPSQALVRYRQQIGVPNAKLAVVGLVANKFTIADPNDAGMMDFVGFDAGMPQVLHDFVTSK